jgi:hypothetical protein
MYGSFFLLKKNNSSNTSLLKFEVRILFTLSGQFRVNLSFAGKYKPFTPLISLTKYTFNFNSPAKCNKLCNSRGLLLRDPWYRNRMEVIRLR